MLKSLLEVFSLKRNTGISFGVDFTGYVLFGDPVRYEKHMPLLHSPLNRFHHQFSYNFNKVLGFSTDLCFSFKSAKKNQMKLRW